MFEEVEEALNHINPDSMNPHNANPSGYNSEFKSMAEKSPDYHDSPEYRKSLHLQGQEKEEVLKNLRAKLGMQGPAGGMGSGVKKHQGVDTSQSNSQGDMKNEAHYGYSTEAPHQEYKEPKYEEPKYEETKYEEPKYEEPKYEEPKSEAPKYTEEASSEAPKYEAQKYEEEEPKYEEDKYEEEPKYEESDSEDGGYGGQEESQEEPDSFKNTLLNL